MRTIVYGLTGAVAGLAIAFFLALLAGWSLQITILIGAILGIIAGLSATRFVTKVGTLERPFVVESDVQALEFIAHQDLWYVPRRVIDGWFSRLRAFLKR